jgi:outer membrane protein
MMVNKKGLSFGLLMMAGFSLHAQEQKHISLQDAIDLSIKTSRQLRVSGARLQQAQASYTEAKDRRLPDISITGSYIRLAQPDIELKIKLNNNSSSGTTGETQSSAPPSVSQAVYGIANASLPLFTGFKIQNGIESAKYLAMASKLDADKDREDVIQNTIAAYSNLYKATAAVRLVQENLRESQERVREQGNLEKNGLLARNDFLKFQLQQSNVELSLLDAENNLHITTENMNLMLGLPVETVIEPDTTFPLDVTDRSLTDWQMLALQNRKDAASLGYRAKAAEAGIRAAKGDYYPSLALTGGYIGAYVENVITIKDAVNIGVGLRYTPSSLWKGNSTVVQAKARLAEVQANQGLLEDAIRLQVVQAYENYLLSKKKIDVYDVAVKQSVENYRIVHNKYTNNLATTTDLLDADVAQLQSKLNYAFAKADASVSYKKLLQTAGLLSAEGAVVTQK